jgi:hypothetical protein
VRFRTHIVAVVALSFLGSMFSGVPASAATPKVTLTLKQSGTSVTVTWKYTGAVPASQILVVTPEKPVVAPLVETSEVPATFDESLAEALLGDGLFTEEPQTITLKKTARSAKVSDLTPGTAYTFTLKSKKPTITSTKRYTVLAKPTKPADVELAWNGDDLVVIWDYEGPRVKEFVVTHTASGAESKTSRTGSADTTFTIDKVAKNVGYTVTVQGTNAAGAGSKAAATILQAAPNRPSNLVIRPLALAGDSVVVSWEYSGPAITGSKVQIKGAGFARDLDTLRFGADIRSAEITGLTAGGTYIFAVTVSNTEDTATSTTEPYKAAKVIAAPTNVAATPGNASVSLKWTAPSADPATPITGYRIDYSEDGNIWRSAIGLGAATSYTVNGLSDGLRYFFRVSATSATGSGLASAALAAPSGQAPSVPTNVKVLSGLRQLIVSWVAPTAGGKIDSYRVEYKATTASTPTTVDNISTTSTTIDGLDQNLTYSITVYARGDSGWSPATTAVQGRPYDLPGVSVITATQAKDRKVDLKWTEAAKNGADIQSYLVEMQAGDSLAWSPVQGSAAPTPTPSPSPSPSPTAGTGTPAAPTSTGVTTTSLTVSNLTLGQVYRFRVTAKNIYGASGAVSLPVSLPLIAAPEVPTLTATAGAGQVTLNWVAPAANGANITAYKIERRTGAGSYVLVSDTVASTTLTYTVTGLINGTKYGFRVSARNSVEWSLPSAAVETTPITRPSAPTYLAATPVVNAVIAGWQAIPAGTPATGGSPIVEYLVSYRVKDGVWVTSPLGPTADTVTQQIIPNLVPGTTYEFQVAAVNAAGMGDYSPVRSAVPYAPPAMVNNLSTVGKSEAIEVTWSRPVLPVSAVIIPALRYRIEYSVDNQSWEELDLATTGPVNITGLRNGVQYSVRVTTAYFLNGTVYDGENVIVKATPRGIPDAPQNLSAQQVNNDIIVSWDPPTNSGGAPLGDYIITSSADGIVWSASDTVTATTLTYTATGLQTGIPHTFRLQSSNTFGPSLYSTIEVVVAPLPKVVGGLKVLRAYNSEVGLSWFASPAREGVTGYKVEQSRDGTRWITVAGLANTQNTTVVVSNLENGNSYQFRVSAINAAGTGPTTSVNALPVGTTSVTNLSATAGDGKVTLRWLAPASGGAGVTLTGVQIKYQQGTDPVVTLPVEAATISSFEVSGLTNGLQYQFWVYSKTSAGDGTADVAFATPTNLAPGPVTSLSVGSVTSSAASLTWVAPAQSGLGAVYYKVEYRLTSASTWLTAASEVSGLTYTLSGLAGNSSYDVRVTAANGVDSSASTFANFTTGT